MSAKVLVIGSINMDLVVSAPRQPLIGETIIGTGLATYPGGKGANQAIAISRMGGAVHFAGCIGDDAFGKVLSENLNSNQVDCAQLKITRTSPTGTALITVDEHGGNSIIVVPGANYCISSEDIDLMEMEIAQAALLVVQLEIPLDCVWKAISLARKHSVPTLLNPAPAHSVPDYILNGLDYIIPNESEMHQLTGISTKSKQDIQRAAKSLLSKGVKRVILTRGEHGCYFYDQQREVELQAYPVHAVDTTAAGDAFIGGLVASLIRNDSIETALQIATAAGALAVTKAGAQTSLPTKMEVDEFIRHQS